MGKPTWVSWTEYLQQHSRHYEPLTLDPHDVAALLKHLREIEARALSKLGPSLDGLHRATV
jgi:hypothetical protein